MKEAKEITRIEKIFTQEFEKKDEKEEKEILTKKELMQIYSKIIGLPTNQINSFDFNIWFRHAILILNHGFNFKEIHKTILLLHEQIKEEELFDVSEVYNELLAYYKKKGK